MKLFTQIIFYVTAIVIYSPQLGNAVRTKDKMYQTIDAAKACFRRLNATHQVGCTSERGGSSGAIHYCERQADLDFILKNGTAPPYVPIIPTTLFTASNLHRLKSTKKISGLLVYASNVTPTYFSHENRCPNPSSSLQGTCPEKGWNPHGTGLLHEDVPFPIFYVEDQEAVAFVRQCFEKHNNHSFGTQRDRSLCSLQLNAFMYATTNSPTCVRRSNAVTNLNPVRFCDPLGDQNVWATLFPLVKGGDFSEPIGNFKYVVVAARLDTTSMFDKTTGAVSPVTGLVTLLATAKFLKTMFPSNVTGDKNVLFLLFNGESYDYIGSQRFLYELLGGNFPAKSSDILPTITIDDIHLFVELSQLGNTNVTVAHYLTNSHVSDFLLKLNTYKDTLIFTESETLPPASFHTFLKNKTDLPGLILADHVDAYSNRFYNSVYDNATNLNYTYLNLTEGDGAPKDNNIQGYVQKVATMLAKSIYVEITNRTYDATDVADLQFIDELLHCYLEDANCRVHKAIQKMELRKQPYSLYVGVEIASNLVTSLIGLTLGWVTGDEVGKSGANCTNEPKNYALRYYNMSRSLDDLNTTLCYRITMNFTEAVSPAFVIKDYDWSSGQYSTWTESTWGDIRLRVFLKPSAAHETMTIAVGSMVFIFSLLFVYFVKSRSDILFTQQLPSLAPTNC